MGRWQDEGEGGRMNWTMRSPTEDGWYWWRPALGCFALILRVQDGWVWEARTHLPTEGQGGEWYGPLVEPGGDAIENCPL